MTVPNDQDSGTAPTNDPYQRISGMVEGSFKNPPPEFSHGVEDAGRADSPHDSNNHAERKRRKRTASPKAGESEASASEH